MKHIYVKSVYDAFTYVMDHYYPYEQDSFALRKDTYAVISIQDTHTEGFGFEFTKNKCCTDVLTLYFDDIVKEIEGCTMFNEMHAKQIIDFIIKNRNVDTLLIHCYAGQSRSRAVGAFAVKIFGKDNSKYFIEGSPNEVVYETLLKVWNERGKEKEG